MKSLGKGLALALAGLGGLGAISIPSAAFSEAPGISQASQQTINKNTHNPNKPSSNKLAAMLGSGIGSWGGRARRAAFGWTNRHARRVAAKKRNLVKHRARSKGSK